MTENNDWGWIYLSNGFQITKVSCKRKKGLKISHVTSNQDKIDPHWIARYCYIKDGFAYLKPGKGRKLHIELNYNNNANGEFYSDVFGIIREYRSMNIQEIKNVCSNLEKIAYEGMNSKKD